MSYDVSPDGQSFIMALINHDSVPDAIDATINWFEWLRQQEARAQ